VRAAHFSTYLQQREVVFRRQPVLPTRPVPGASVEGPHFNNFGDLSYPPRTQSAVWFYGAEYTLEAQAIRWEHLESIEGMVKQPPHFHRRQENKQ
jgi:hypothetical protein